MRAENEQLTALVQLQSGLDHETVATRVIGRETLDTRRVVILDKGTDDGIEEGDVVIVQGGALAGRVTDVGPTFSKVTLISDATSTVVGQLAESGKSGEVVGQAGGVLIMRNIDSAVPISTDEEVFTAGIEVNAGIRSPYPKGLVIGSVVDVQRDANDVVQTAFLAPAAELDSFELALVITDYEGGLPPADEQPVPCGEQGHGPRGRGPLLHADAHAHSRSAAPCASRRVARAVPAAPARAVRLAAHRDATCASRRRRERVGRDGMRAARRRAEQPRRAIGCRPVGRIGRSTSAQGVASLQQDDAAGRRAPARHGAHGAPPGHPTAAGRGSASRCSARSRRWWSLRVSTSRTTFARGSSRCLSRRRRSSAWASRTCVSRSTKHGRRSPDHRVPRSEVAGIGSGDLAAHRERRAQHRLEALEEAAAGAHRARRLPTGTAPSRSAGRDARPAQHSCTRSGRAMLLRSSRPHCAGRHARSPRRASPG